MIAQFCKALWCDTVLDVKHEGAELELTAIGAAFKEVMHATEEMHHKQVSLQHLAHVEDDGVLIVSCK